MHHERRSRAASGSECKAIDDAEAPRDCELQLGRQVKECHASFESRLVCSRLVCDGRSRERAADARNVRGLLPQPERRVGRV